MCGGRHMIGIGDRAWLVFILHNLPIWKMDCEHIAQNENECVCTD